MYRLSICIYRLCCNAALTGLGDTLTHVRPGVRSSRTFGCAILLSPFPKRAQVPGANPLKDAQAALAAYGFSAKKDLLAQLLALNQQVAAKIEKKEPVMSPGAPKNYPEAKKPVTADCVKPAQAVTPPTPRRSRTYASNFDSQTDLRQRRASSSCRQRRRPTVSHEEMAVLYPAE